MGIQVRAFKGIYLASHPYPAAKVGPGSRAGGKVYGKLSPLCSCLSVSIVRQRVWAHCCSVESVVGKKSQPRALKSGALKTGTCQHPYFCITTLHPQNTLRIMALASLLPSRSYADFVFSQF